MKLNDQIVIEEIHLIETSITAVIQSFIDMKCSFTSNEEYIALYFVTEQSLILKGMMLVSDLSIILLEGNSFS